MDQAHEMKLLRQIPLFAELTDAELGEVFKMATPVKFQPGEIICQQGQPGDAMYVLEEGKAQVTVRSERGQSVPVATLEAVDIFGELSLVDDQPRSASVVAMTPVVGLRVDRTAFNNYRANLHPVAFKMLRRITLTVCDRMRVVTAHLSGNKTAAPARAASNATLPRTEQDRSFWKSVSGLFGG